MKIILLKDIKNLGKVNDIVEVKDGYAVNYLLPYKFAIVANEKTISNIKQKIKTEKNILEKKSDILQILLDKIALKPYSFTLKINKKTNKITGKITHKMIEDEIKKGLTNDDLNLLPKKFFETASETFSTEGNYDVKIKFSADVKGIIKIQIKRHD